MGGTHNGIIDAKQTDMSLFNSHKPTLSQNTKLLKLLTQVSLIINLGYRYMHKDITNLTCMSAMIPITIHSEP